MRTKGIQLITASSITVSKGLTKQLIYEWQRFRCSHQHLKQDLQVWKANVLIVQKEQGRKTWKLLFKSATSWLLVMTGDVNESLQVTAWPSSKITENQIRLKKSENFAPYSDDAIIWAMSYKSCAFVLFTQHPKIIRSGILPACVYTHNIAV